MEPAIRPGLVRLSLIYVMILILGYLIAFGLYLAVGQFLGFAPEGSFMAFLLPLLASVFCGAHYYSKSGERPPKGLVWKSAFVFTIIVSVFKSAILWYTVWSGALDGAVPGFSMSSPEDRNVVFAVAAFMVAMYFFTNALWLWAGGRSAMQGEKRKAKLAERKAKKQAAKNGG